jgi:transglutaminase-like putative cysteine protease
MRLTIHHTTRYSFSLPVNYGLQQLRKTPKSYRAQQVLNWKTDITNGTKETTCEDQHRNKIDLVSVNQGATELVIENQGVVEMTDTHGIVGPHQGPAPLWLFERTTPLTKPGKAVRELARSVAEGTEPLERMHNLSRAVSDAVVYQTGVSETSWTAEKVLDEGQGVCQDHAHVFIACARSLGVPARYVSGYLMMDGQVEQEAMHAWVEAHIDGLGWVGFDVSNKISPDMRYVRVATGLDYTEAAPVSGIRMGGDTETLSVSIEVAQQ